MRICIGGTFDILHRGHKTLLDRAFEIAGKDGVVFIGLSNGELAKSKDLIHSYEERKRGIEDYLKVKGLKNYKIVPIHDRYGLTLDEDFDVIVVSEETFEVAREINRIRKEKGLKEIQIVKIPMVKGEDGKPISTSRIRRGEIDEEGRISSKRLNRNS